MSAAGVLETVERIVDDGGDPEDVLQNAVKAIVDDQPLIERIAATLSPYCRQTEELE